MSKLLIRLFAFVGFVVFVLYVAATLGFGYFVVYYGPHPVECGIVNSGA